MASEEALVIRMTLTNSHKPTTPSTFSQRVWLQHRMLLEQRNARHGDHACGARWWCRRPSPLPGDLFLHDGRGWQHAAPQPPGLPAAARTSVRTLPCGRPAVLHAAAPVSPARRCPRPCVATTSRPLVRSPGSTPTSSACLATHRRLIPRRSRPSARGEPQGCLLAWSWRIPPQVTPDIVTWTVFPSVPRFRAGSRLFGPDSLAIHAVSPGAAALGSRMGVWGMGGCA